MVPCGGERSGRIIWDLLCRVAHLYIYRVFQVGHDSNAGPPRQVPCCVYVILVCSMKGMWLSEMFQVITKLQSHPSACIDHYADTYSGGTVQVSSVVHQVSRIHQV